MESAAPPSPRDPAPQGEERAISAEGTPLATARALLAEVTRSLAAMPSESPRLNPARAQARALTKLVADLEGREAERETPEDAERRRRREARETIQAIEQHVLRAEAEATARGVCIHCGQALRA